MSTNLKVAAINFIVGVTVFVLFTHFVFNFAWGYAIKMGVISCGLGTLIFVFWFRKKLVDKK